MYQDSRRHSHKDLYNPHYVAWRGLLQDAEQWDAGTIRDWRAVQLRETLRRAYKAPGYRALWGCLPTTLDGLPFLTREMLRDDLEAFSVDTPGRYKVSTGGSSGIPISVYRDPISFARELASKAHQYGRLLWREGDPQLTMRGRVVRNYVEYDEDLNELRLSSFHLTDSQMETYYHEALSFGPLWLRCYPSAGYLFAKYLLDTGRALPLSGVLCASEKLYPFQREAMEGAFRCRVFSHYGSYELSALAGYCEYADTYHVLPFYGITEILDEDGRPVGRGETGEIVATSFIATATPIVRYRTGDLATYRGEHCPECGRPYQIWTDVEGRRWEFIVTKSGRKLSPAALNEHGSLYDCMRQFRYYQRKVGEVEFLFIPRHDVDMVYIHQQVKAKLGDDVDLRVRAVAELPLTPRGKHGFLVQELEL